MGDNVGCRKIAECFNRGNHKGETVSKTYVANIIAKHQYEIQIERRKIKNKLPRWVAVNCTWAMDLSFYSTADKTIQPFLGIIDHGSRKALTLQTLINKTELQHWLSHFRTWYNQQRPHQHLGGKTPEDVWRQRRKK